MLPVGRAFIKSVTSMDSFALATKFLLSSCCWRYKVCCQRRRQYTRVVAAQITGKAALLNNLMVVG